MERLPRQALGIDLMSAVRQYVPVPAARKFLAHRLSLQPYVYKEAEETMISFDNAQVRSQIAS